MVRTFVLAAVVGVSVVGGARAEAAPIVIHNTGVDVTDALVALGGEAAFWALVSAPAGASEAVGSPVYEHKNPAYAANTAVSQWVAPSPEGDASAFGDYAYETTFDLTGFDHTTASIAGLFSSDNEGFIRLNGGAPVLALDNFSFKSMHAFSFTSGFVAGLNVIQVGARNGGNPTAFRVQFTEATADRLPRVPEPTTLALLGVGLAFVLASRPRA